MSQRYRLTHEFALRYPADYHAFKRAVESALNTVHEGFTSAPDYLAIERADTAPTHEQEVLDKYSTPGLRRTTLTTTTPTPTEEEPS